jgi:hypothetical protein
MAGPPLVAALPMVEKIPAPTMAAIPKAVKSLTFNDRFKANPVAASFSDSCNMPESDLVRPRDCLIFIEMWKLHPLKIILSKQFVALFQASFHVSVKFIDGNPVKPWIKIKITDK